MVKIKQGKDFKPRKKGKDKKKNTFKKYGKNTSRGMRIKESEIEKNIPQALLLMVKLED